MSEPTLLTIHTDGASRGNPGPSAFGFIINSEQGERTEGFGTLGTMTNNQAEYQALLHALEKAATLDGKHRILILSDSQLMVNQLKGEWKVKDPGMQDLFAEAQKLRRQFAAVDFRYIPREQNKEADRLCNLALDGPKKERSPAQAKTMTRVPPQLELAVREPAIECLRAAAQVWARGNPNIPPVDMVWEQLWSILEEERVLRK